MTPEETLALVAGQRLGVLATLRRGGRPQTSNIVYAVRGSQVLVAVTEDRAKTRILRRDPRADLHVSTSDGSAWAAVEGTAELSPVTSVPATRSARRCAGSTSTSPGPSTRTGTSTTKRWATSAAS